MSKYKRTNYLIDKPFQLGFILKYLVVIILSIALCSLLAVGYLYYRSLFGDNKFNETVIIQKRTAKTRDGFTKYNYEKEKISVCETLVPGEYKVINAFSSEKYQKDDIIKDIDKNELTLLYGTETKVTNIFYVVLPPILILCFTIMLIIAVYSLFFSHRMAGPIYRIRVSLDRMNQGDLDFSIRARKGDFFLNIVEKLEHFRIKVKNNDFGADFPYEKINELKKLVKDGADKDEILNKINQL